MSDLAILGGIVLVALAVLLAAVVMASMLSSTLSRREERWMGEREARHG